MSHWFGWVSRHPGPLLLTVGALLTGAGTLYLAFATVRLAKGSKRLAEITEKQGQNNQDDNKRHDALLRDTFLAENRRKVYRDLLYYLTKWRQSFEDLKNFAEHSMSQHGSLPISDLMEISKLAKEWPLDQTFDQVRMSVEIDLDADPEIVSRAKNWTDFLNEALQYLKTLSMSIDQGIPSLPGTRPVEPLRNPFNELSERFPDHPSLIPSDRNVNQILTSIMVIVGRMQSIEGEIEDIAKRNLDIRQIS